MISGSLKEKLGRWIWDKSNQLCTFVIAVVVVYQYLSGACIYSHVEASLRICFLCGDVIQWLEQFLL